jgi:hypothetical protein
LTYPVLKDLWESTCVAETYVRRSIPRIIVVNLGIQWYLICEHNCFLHLHSNPRVLMGRIVWRDYHFRKREYLCCKDL